MLLVTSLLGPGAVWRRMELHLRVSLRRGRSTMLETTNLFIKCHIITSQYTFNILSFLNLYSFSGYLKNVKLLKKQTCSLLL
mgnify:CR=1 FL=1